jgi:hypothetical protein
MAKKDTADILALGDKEDSPKQEYDVSGLAGLVKSKFIDAENARQFDEQRWLRAYRNYRGVYGNDMHLLNQKNQKYLLK